MTKRLAFLFVFSLVLVTSAFSQPAPYVVDGLALGARVLFDSETYRRYQCTASEYPGLTRCHKEKTEKTKRGEVTSSNSILHKQDGTTVYVNRYVEPAFFSLKDIRDEVDRLSAHFGERAREIRMPQRQGLPNAVIAVWGRLELKQLDATDVSILASGGSPHKGILVSFLGDLQRSARSGVPVYQLVGGAGYLWVATFNQDGKGVLRFLTIDASQIVPSIAQNRPVPPLEAPVRPSPTVSTAAECLIPTKQSQLQTISGCTNAMCCPRELNLQINLVRAVAQKLKALGYTIADPKAQPEDSPDLSGIYYPSLRSAVSQYKQDHKIADGNADITYELVATLLGVNLFERWR